MPATPLRISRTETEEEAYTWGVQKATRMSKDVNQGDLILPGWFLKIVAIAVLPCLPVALWVVVEVRVMRNQIATLTTSQSSYVEHISDPNIHHSAFRVVESRIKALSDRIEALEKRDK